MRYYESNCCDCGLPCVYESCPHYMVEYFKCDFCKEENVKLYEYNDWEVCGDCLLAEFRVVSGSDDY